MLYFLLRGFCASHLCQTQRLKLFYFNAFLFSNLIEGMCRVLYRSWWIMRSDQWVHLQTGTGERRVRRKLSGWHHLDYELHDLVNCLLIINNVLFVYGSCVTLWSDPLHFDPINPEPVDDKILILDPSRGFPVALKILLKILGKVFSLGAHTVPVTRKTELKIAPAIALPDVWNNHTKGTQNYNVISS